MDKNRAAARNVKAMETMQAQIEELLRMVTVLTEQLQPFITKEKPVRRQTKTGEGQPHEQA